MTKVVWKKYKTWSGCLIAGQKQYVLSGEEEKQHMYRALWLTAQVEGGGKFGAINSYDGAAMSAGLEHKIAIYPKTLEQGTLWSLLREMELYGHCEELAILWDEFKNGPKWYISQDGKLRRYTNGDLISATEIRNVLTPPAGKVPNSGPRWEEAKRWALLFHNLFSAKETYQVQINSAITSLVEGNKKAEEEAYKKTVGVSHPTLLSVNDNINLEMDLAWCVYHSFSVNAPSKGRERLVFSNPNSSKSYPKTLIKTLATTNYGKWHDTKDGANRYDRTRKYAFDSGFWPIDFFEGPNAIMPENF